MAIPQITGTLPFQGLTNQSVQFQGLGGTPQQAMAQLGTNYANAYNSAIAMNEANYGNILQGYQDVRANQGNAQDAIAGGYTDLYNQLQQSQQGITGGYGEALKGLQGGGMQLAQGYSGLNNAVLGGIQGIGQSRARDIASSYQAQSGRLSNDLVSRGLGNSTVQSALQAGLAFNQERSQNDLAEQIAGLRAGYQSQLGLAGLGSQQQQLMAENQQRNLGLGYQNQAALQLANQGQQGLDYRQRALMGDTALAQNQLGWMNSVNSPYPDAGMYANLAQMYGAQQQAGTNAANDARLLAMGQRELRNNSGVNPALMTPPGYARSAGGGPPASAMMQTGTSGGGLFGAGGFGLGLAPAAAPNYQNLVGTGAGAFGGGIGGFGGYAQEDYANNLANAALGGVGGYLGQQIEGSEGYADPYGALFGGAGSAALDMGYGGGYDYGTAPGDFNWDTGDYYGY